MKELSYRVPQPHFLRLTLEDCALCLKNLADPLLYSVAVKQSNDVDDEIHELQDTQESLKEMNISSDDDVDMTTSAAVNSRVTNKHKRPDTVLSDMFKHSTAFTEAWLIEYFEEEEGGSVARCEIYKYYLENCQRSGITPCNPANFGKVMRIVFPNLLTRRIGVRGHSKYHYVGIAPRMRVKKNTVTTNEHRGTDENVQVSSRMPVQDNRLDQHDNVTDIMSLLSDFPTVEDMEISTELKNQICELLKVYKLHAVQIINDILNADFYKVRDHLVEFWKCLPVSLLDVPNIMDVLSCCDRKIYKVISDVLIPHVCKSLPVGMSQALVDFAENYHYWLDEIMSEFPTFRRKKLQVCSEFRTSIQRRVNISHMAASARFVLHSHDSMKQLLKDWQEVDVVDIAVHCQNVFTNNRDIENKIRSYMVRLQQLMIQNSTLDQYMAWIEAVVNQNMQNIVKVKNPENLIKEFILDWSYVSAQIIQQLTLNTSASIGSFHLLDLLFKDYALYLLEEWIQP